MSSSKNSNSTQLGFESLNINNLPCAEEEHLARRRLANAIRQLVDKSIRLNTDTDTINNLAQQLESIESKMDQHGRLELENILSKLATTTASKADLLNISDYALMTGFSNPVSVPIKVWIEDNRIKGAANIGIAYQGPPGRVHGGVIAAIFDVLLANSLQLDNTRKEPRKVTANLKVKYRHGVPLDTDLILEAQIVRAEGRRVISQGTIKVGEQVCAEAEGVWVKPLKKWTKSPAL